VLLHPGADAWTPTSMSQPVFDRVAATKRLQELTNGSHLPLEQPAWDELRDAIRLVLEAIQTGRQEIDN
jgi:hypothetical protein